MRLFKFGAGTSPTDIKDGQAINHIKSALWVERYREPGEFQITALLSSGLKEQLPPGTLISHDGTYELMVVENHTIREEEDQNPEINISGRSLESYLEERVVGINESLASPVMADYVIPSAKTWAQTVDLINDHILTATDVNDRLAHVQAVSYLGAAPGVEEDRVVSRSNLHQAVIALLAVEDLGIRTIRRNPFGEIGSDTHTLFEVHAGQDVSDKVAFSWKAGDLNSGEYLWSNKRLRNAALIVGRFVSTQVYLGPTGYDRRWMIVDGQEIDGIFSAAPTGGDLTTVISKMQTLGRQALANQNTINIVRSDISQQNQYRYRQDYRVGDIVTVSANFGEIGKMRVLEYVESLTEDGGFEGYPTLSLIGEPT